MCDCEMPTVSNESVCTARKAHVCCECDEIITPKSQYSILKGLWDGEWKSYKTCNSCKDIADKFLDYTNETSYPLGGLIEELHNSDLIENRRDEDGKPVWVSNVEWLEIKNQSPLKLGVIAS